MQPISSVLLGALLVSAVTAWPASSDLPGDIIFSGGCSAATGTVPSSLVQTILDDFNNENSAVAQMVKKVCSDGNGQTSYEATQDMPGYSAKFKISRAEGGKYEFCENAPFYVLRECINKEGNKNGGQVRTTFNPYERYQTYDLVITAKEEQPPTPPDEPPPTITGSPQCRDVPNGFDVELHKREDINIQAVIVSLCTEGACSGPEESAWCRRTMRRKGFQISATRRRGLVSGPDHCKAAMKSIYDSCWKEKNQEGSVVVLPQGKLMFGEIYTLNITEGATPIIRKAL